MTFKELKRFISNNSSNISSHNESAEKVIKPQSAERFAIFTNKPFWISDISEHRNADIANKGACCFNHIIGLPLKDGVQKPIFDYEMDVFNQLQQYQDIFIKKARGLGVTELLLRFMIWLCVRDNTYRNTRFHIVTGPRINLAEDLIDRIYNMLIAKQNIICPRSGPIIYVNNVTIQAFPSHTVSSARGYTDVKFILLDEADYFPIGQREEARAVAEGYRIKTRPWVILVSTPARPGGLFDSIEHEDNSSYHKILLPYTLGLDKIYNSAVQYLQMTTTAT